MDTENGHHFTFAGVAITSNREAKLPSRGFSDCRLDVRFCDLQGFEDESKRTAHWLPVPSDGTAEGLLSPEGTCALVIDPGFSSAQCAAEIRRIVPFSAALQGKVLLHAGAVLLDGSAIVFIGESGAGKSTLAAALESKGFPVICDDLLPCRERPGGVVTPVEHRTMILEPCISHIFFLSRCHGLRRPQLAPILPRQQLQLLLKHGFGEMRNKVVWRLQFQTYGRLSSEVSSFNLKMPDDLSMLDSSIDFLVKFIKRLNQDNLR